MALQPTKTLKEVMDALVKQLAPPTGISPNLTILAKAARETPPRSAPGFPSPNVLELTRFSDVPPSDEWTQYVANTPARDELNLAMTELRALLMTNPAPETRKLIEKVMVSLQAAIKELV